MNPRRILILMSGSIAAYKICHVISRLVQAGHEVQVAASAAALKFVGPASLEGLSGKPVASDLWESGRAMDHIHLIRKADLVLAAPATAHLINRMASGLGDDLLTTLFLAHDFKKPFLVAPAMNTTMYLHPTTQASLTKLKDMGLRILETASGVLACGETGFGKLLDPELILKEVLASLPPEEPAAGDPKKPGPRIPNEARRAPKVLITAGGTTEPLDDVRVLTNGSTGKSGAELATRLSGLGFDVTLLRARDAVAPEPGDIKQKQFLTYDDLKDSLASELSSGSYSHIVHMAAVSDYRIDQVLLDGQPASGRKIPSGASLTLRLKPTGKILDRLKTWGGKDLRVMAFKLTSHAALDERRAAAEKLFPSADVVVSNDLRDIGPEQHPYLLKTPLAEVPLSGLSELTAWTSNWLQNQEAP